VTGCLGFRLKTREAMQRAVKACLELLRLAPRERTSSVHEAREQTVTKAGTADLPAGLDEPPRMPNEGHRIASRMSCQTTLAGGRGGEVFKLVNVATKVHVEFTVFFSMPARRRCCAPCLSDWSRETRASSV